MEGDDRDFRLIFQPEETAYIGFVMQSKGTLKIWRQTFMLQPGDIVLVDSEKYPIDGETLKIDSHEFSVCTHKMRRSRGISLRD